LSAANGKKKTAKEFACSLTQCFSLLQFVPPKRTWSQKPKKYLSSGIWLIRCLGTGLNRPMTGTVALCACAANGKVAALPTSAMNSRRLMPVLEGQNAEV
jgi:hypothetical protein